MREDSSAARRALHSETAPAMPPPDAEALTPLVEVARRQGVAPLAERLADMRAWLAEDFLALEAQLENFERGALAPRAGEDIAARRAARHLLSQPGKRIRPLCVMLAARLGGRAMDAAVCELAVVVEVIHAATLLHDDVIDDGHERRGAPTARVVFGNSASVLGGDHLLVAALRRVQALGRPALQARLLDVIAEIVCAEALQLERRGRFEVDRQSYLNVIEGKTAALFRWALFAGASVAGLPADDVTCLERCGDALGLAFQLIDDVLDLEGDMAQIGKDVCADLREGKLTWPLIVAAERDPQLRALLRELAQQGATELPEPVLRELLGRVRSSGALDETRALARQRGAEAKMALRRFPPSRARAALELAIDAACHRSR